MEIPLLSTFFKKAKDRQTGWIAVCISKSGVCLAEIESAGIMPRVVRCECHETSAGMVPVLEKLRREAKVGNRGVTTLLAQGEYQILMVESPNVPANEMKTAVRWKIKDGLGFHIDDATVDVVSVPAGGQGSGRPQYLYAIAAANSVIQERMGVFEQAKIGLQVIDIPEMAQRNIAALFEHKDRALALLVLDDTGGLMTFTSGGELYLSRRIEMSMGQLLDADEGLRFQYRDRLVTEMQRSLDYFDRQFNHLTVDTILVCVSDSSGLVEFLMNELVIKVQKLDLSQVMDISAVSALADNEFVARALPVLGAALRREVQA